MLKVYGFSRVTRFAHGVTKDLRILWALEEMQMPYEIVGMDHTGGALDADAFRDVSPFQQLPAIDDASTDFRVRVRNNARCELWW